MYDDGCISSEDSETNRKFVSLQLQEIIKVAISKVSKHDDKMHYTFIKVRPCGSIGSTLTATL